MRYQRNIKIIKKRVDGTAFSTVLVFIIFFLLLESSLIFKPGISVSLPSPKSVKLPGITGPSLMIGIDRLGQYYLSGKALTDEEILKQLIRAKEKNTDTTIVIVSDKDTKVEALANLSAMTYQSGLQKVLIATRPYSSAAGNSVTPSYENKPAKQSQSQSVSTP